MDSQSAKDLLASCAGEENEEPVYIPKAVLKQLSSDDLPIGVHLGIGENKAGVIHTDWSGYFWRNTNGLFAVVEECNTRKYWSLPLNLEHYMDIVKKAVVNRAMNRGDVELLHDDDDGAYIHLTYKIKVPIDKSLAVAYDHALDTATSIEECALLASQEVGKIASGYAERASGWGDMPLDKLVEKTETIQTSNAKGQALEELSVKLFNGVSGFETIGRLKTATEEIDITILNGSTNPLWQKESAIVLVECKNWSSKCGKNEFVIFREKIRNRKNRCNVGFLISWNGFAETVTKEMIRGSHEDPLVVPIDGRLIREAVLNGSFEELLMKAYQKAIMI